MQFNSAHCLFIEASDVYEAHTTLRDGILSNDDKRKLSLTFACIEKRFENEKTRIMRDFLQVAEAADLYQLERLLPEDLNSERISQFFWVQELNQQIANDTMYQLVMPTCQPRTVQEIWTNWLHN